MNIDIISTPDIKLRKVKKESIDYIDLRTSIEQGGIINPIIVRPKGDGYEVVDGNHRLEAAKELGLNDVPVIIKEFSDSEALCWQIQMNAHMIETKPTEYARIIKRMIDIQNLDINQICIILNKNKRWVSNILKLDMLPDNVKEMVDNKVISLRHGILLTKFMELKNKSIPKILLDKARSLPHDDFRDFINIFLRNNVSVTGVNDREDNKEVGPKLRTIKEIRDEMVKNSYNRHYVRGLQFAISLDDETYALRRKRMEDYADELNERDSERLNVITK